MDLFTFQFNLADSRMLIPMILELLAGDLEQLSKCAPISSALSGMIYSATRGRLETGHQDEILPTII
jgi:hypothetical protein